ncbi:MAG: 50S ribosomal protein L25/general stress protein Ctc [Chroococcales cyanobacterium]
MPAIQCQERPTDKNPRALRREGLIPATLYGHDKDQSVSVTLNAKDVKNLLKEASVNNTIVDVSIPHTSWTGKALIRELQTHPWKPEVYHLSFFAVKAGDTLDVVVPLHLVGEAAGIKSGGVVDQIVTELAVQCTPANIPDSIDLDVSGLDIGENLHIRDIKVPEGVVIMDDGDRTAVAVVAPRAVTEAQATEEVAPELAEAMSVLQEAEEKAEAEGEG